MGIFRKYKETQGKTLVVEVPVETWEEIEKALDMKDGLVDAEVVMDELKIGKKTLSNLISSGKIHRGMYTIAVNGLKKFHIWKILGLKRRKVA